MRRGQASRTQAKKGSAEEKYSRIFVFKAVSLHTCSATRCSLTTRPISSQGERRSVLLPPSSSTSPLLLPPLLPMLLLLLPLLLSFPFGESVGCEALLELRQQMHACSWPPPLLASAGGRRRWWRCLQASTGFRSSACHGTRALAQNHGFPATTVSPLDGWEGGVGQLGQHFYRREFKF